MTVTDERVRMMNELLNCVKLIKMYAWEKSFAASVSGMAPLFPSLFVCVGKWRQGQAETDGKENSTYMDQGSFG